MTPFEEVLGIAYLRAGLFDSLGCEPGESVEDCAENMVAAWPRLADIWPADAPGREVVSLALLGGMPKRKFIGMEYPPILPAVRWCLLTQGISLLEMRPTGAEMFLPSSGDVHRSMGVSLYHVGGIPPDSPCVYRRKLEEKMRAIIGNTFCDLLSLSTEMIPHIGHDWWRTYHLSWHLPTDRTSTKLTVARNGSRTRENHCFDLSSCSTDHLERFIELVAPLTETKARKDVY